MPHFTCSTVPVLGSIEFQYDIMLYKYGQGKEDTYCGKGLLDNLHGTCKGQWPKGWKCEFVGLKEEGNMKVNFRLPKINKYNCVEDAIAAASYNRVWQKCEGINALRDTIATAFSVGSMAIPIPVAGAASSVAGTVARVAAGAAKGVANGVSKAASTVTRVGEKVGEVAKKTSGKMMSKGAKKGIKEGNNQSN